MRNLLLLLLPSVAMLGCETTTVPPEQPPIAPVVRIAGMSLVVHDSDSLDQALATREALRPTGIVLAGELAPTLDGGPEAATVEALGTLSEALGSEPDIGVGVQVAALGTDVPASMCFDPEHPTDDATLAGRSTALASLLLAHPEIDEVSIDLAADVAPWDVPCTCTPCDTVGAAGQANRLNAVYGAFDVALDDHGRSGWWMDALTVAAPDVDLGEVMATALDEGVGAHARVRASGHRGPSHRWAADNPTLDEGANREVVADLDLCGQSYGDTDALLLFPRRLHDRIGHDRERGVVAWFADTKCGSRTAWDGLAVANLEFALRLFRELEVTPETLALEWTGERFGLAPELEDTASLAAALGATGRALELATHPLGIAVADVGAGARELPLTWDDPRPWDDRWADRWETLAFPSQSDLVAIHQWGAEGHSLAAAAFDAVQLASASLDPDDFEELQQGTLALEQQTRAWRLLVNADVTLRVWQEAPNDDLASWLRHDADSLDELADQVETRVAAGQVDPSPHSDPGTLRAVAGQLRAAVGPGVAVDRPFPAITEVGATFEEDRTNVRWTLRPGGLGWWERGPGWPAEYDDSSSVGTSSAVFWHGWTPGLMPETRVPFRTCGDVDGAVVCSSDRVLWTP
ncbi:MAG: hypothetical protein GY898_06475 [Proteobacteria bacterium]|nr:hypothetical protein [Pseudomonadota bacterium]